MLLAKRLAFFRFDLCFGIIKGEQPLIRGSSASKSLALFWFSFGAKREQSPPGCSASKSLRPCRAEHAAFASQTGLRLKSPTGAFMPSGHRRPFWFSFGAKREQTPPGCSASKSPCPCRAEHAAFASQTGLRLKSPTGAFMPSGHRRPFWFSFGAKREQTPPGCSASKSPCPCRAEHAAFASQTGLRLKSPTGAFMPSGHRRPFWFSFGAKREQTPPGEALSSKPETFIYLLFFRFHCSRRIHARMLR